MEEVVQHCILTVATEERRATTVGTYSMAEHEHTLFGVSYFYAVPQNMEFGANGNIAYFLDPRGRGRRAPVVFLRLLGRSAGPTAVRIRVQYQLEENEWQDLMQISHGQSLPFPEVGEHVLDIGINLPYLRVGGLGLHALSVHFRPWDETNEETADEATEPVDPYEPPPYRDTDEFAQIPNWHHGATEYFEIVRAS